MLPKDEEAILRFLYEKKDAETRPSVADICASTGLSRQVARRAMRSLEEKGMISGPPDLLKQTMAALNDQDKNFGPTDPGYAEHVILLASAISKADEQFLADELGYDIEFVSLVGSRLRSSGIWVGDHLSDESQKDWCEDGGGITFYLEGAVATGDLIAVERNDKGERQWKMTEGGLKRGANLIKGMKREE
jgi:DNA-binding transcriptional ArsR family regulator